MPLFDKFAASGQGTRRSPIEGILENLKDLLNTKREYGSPLPDYGIRTLTEYYSREYIARAVIQDVRECIERYEPRLTLHEIVLNEDKTPFRLSFTVRCSLRNESELLHVSFDTLLHTFDVARP